MDLIIGAGVTGLSYAAYSANDYLILEKEKEVGGYCRTIKQDGFIWDYSGHFFHFQDKSIKDYIFNNLNKDEILYIVKETQIFHKGSFIDYPFQKNIHQLSKEELIDCLYDLFENDITAFSSFKEMLYAKFGKSIAELFLIPYNEKLYACDLNKLDTNAMGRFFPYADKEDIIRNFRTTANSSYNASFVYPKGGAIEYVNSIVKNLDKDKIIKEEKLIGINPESHVAYTDKRKIKYDNLISTMPFPDLLKLCKITYDKNLYTSNKVLVFNIGFDKAGTNKNHWIYFADPAIVFYRVGMYNNIFGIDRLSIYVEIGLREDADFNEKELLEKTLADLRKVGLTADHNMVSYSSVLMDPAYVHITGEMESDRAKKMRLLNENDIFSIGRYGAWYYCSIEDNIKEAKSLAEKLCKKSQ